jgi:hypothetical protein
MEAKERIGELAMNKFGAGSITSFHLAPQPDSVLDPGGRGSI